MKKQKKCMADGGMPKGKKIVQDETPEWKKSLASAWQAIAGSREPPKDKPPTADSLSDTANRIRDRHRQVQEIASYANGGIPGQVETFQAGVQPMAVGTGITPPNMVPTEAQGLAAAGAPTGGALTAAAQQAPIPAATPGNVFANPQAGNMLTPSGGSMTMAEKSRAAGLDPNAAYRPGSAQDPHASGLSGLARKPIPAPELQHPAPQVSTQAPTISTQAPTIETRQRVQTKTPGLADGGMARHRFEGKGGPRDDQIPVTVAGEKIKVSDGEEAVILPAKTAQNPQAIAAIGSVIEQSNDGRKPAMGMSEGGKYAAGARPHIVDPRGQVYVNGRPAGLLPAPPAPEITRTNFVTDSAGGTRPVPPPGQAIARYVPPPATAPAIEGSLSSGKGMAYNAGRAVGKAAGSAGGISGLAGSAIKAAVPLVAAYQTFGDDGIKVQGNRASDPNYDETSGMPRVGSSLKEVALRAGDWGTKGLDILGGWALPEGEASFNDAYRQGVGQLEGVSAPTSQQVAAQNAQKQIASAPQATYSNEGRLSAIQTANNTPDPRIAQNTGNAGDARVDPASGNLHFTQKGFDPTQQQFAPGSGAITDPKTGRTILVPPQAIAQAPDNAPRDQHGNDMTQTLALRDELNRARADRAWQNMNSPTEGYRQQGMAQLQALAQIGALDTESMRRLGMKQNNDANIPGADRELKGQAIAQGGLAMQQAQELNALYAAHNAEQNPEKRSMIAEQIRVRTGKERQDKPIAVDMGETISADGMMKAKNPNVLWDPNTRQAIQLGGSQPLSDGKTLTKAMQAELAPALKRSGITIEQYAKQHGLTIGK